MRGGKNMPQLRGLTSQLAKHLRCAVTVLNTGTMNAKCNQVAARLGHDLTLAALDALASIIAAYPPVFSGFHAVTINHTRY